MVVRPENKVRLEALAKHAKALLDAVEDRMAILAPGNERLPVLIILGDPSLTMSMNFTNLRDPRRWINQLRSSEAAFKRYTPRDTVEVPGGLVDIGPNKNDKVPS